MRHEYPEAFVGGDPGPEWYKALWQATRWIRSPPTGCMTAGNHSKKRRAAAKQAKAVGGGGEARGWDQRGLEEDGEKKEGSEEDEDEEEVVLATEVWQGGG